MKKDRDIIFEVILFIFVILLSVEIVSALWFYFKYR